MPCLEGVIRIKSLAEADISFLSLPGEEQVAVWKGIRISFKGLARESRKEE